MAKWQSGKLKKCRELWNGKMRKNSETEKVAKWQVASWILKKMSGGRVPTIFKWQEKFLATSPLSVMRSEVGVMEK